VDKKKIAKKGLFRAKKCKKVQKGVEIRAVLWYDILVILWA
jgi:hypothetical protein